jgi:signal transduction histidine kinase
MTEIIRALLVDDDEEDFIITRDILDDISRKKYVLEWVDSYDKAREIIPRNAHDVYLIDYRLGIHNGLELIREAIKDGCTGPLILLTGQGDQEIDEQAMKTGAADYLVKGTLNPYYLERSIRYSMQHARNLAEIRQLNADLEKRVEQRTQDLGDALKQLEQTNQILKVAERDLLKALEKERELNTLKSKFVTIASHEFRTPLSTILSSASLIAKYNAPDDESKRGRHIDRIKSAVNNLTGILNDFLSFGKLEEGKIGYNPAEVDLIPLSEEIVEEMSAVLKEGQQIRYRHEGERSVIFADKQVLKNALINLISNASKYSAAGKPIDFISRLQDRALTIIVQDYGIGIPEADKVHLFSQFFRAQNATNIQGTGLGLTIVKKYVELLGGTVSFSSEEGTGTTFTLHLPG